jgi:rare lipoprotein A
MQTLPRRAGGSLPWLFFCAATVAAGFTSSLARGESAGSPPSTVGQASWYGSEFQYRRTASGERFDPRNLTGAHRTLPMGTKVRVTNLRNGRSVLVVITDRGPFRRRRDIDVSLGAARALGFVERGVERVLIEPLT